MIPPHFPVVVVSSANFSSMGTFPKVIYASKVNAGAEFSKTPSIWVELSWFSAELKLFSCRTKLSDCAFRHLVYI